MKCKVGFCGEETTHGKLCPRHDLEWEDSKEFDRADYYAGPSLGTSPACRIAFADFIRRIEAEERNSIKENEHV